LRRFGRRAWGGSRRSSVGPGRPKPGG